jgi:hypothetical protein
LTDAGLVVLCGELYQGACCLLDLPPATLRRIVRSGISPETVERVNAAAEAAFAISQPQLDDE